MTTTLTKLEVVRLSKLMNNNKFEKCIRSLFYQLEIITLINFLQYYSHQTVTTVLFNTYSSISFTFEKHLQSIFSLDDHHLNLQLLRCDHFAFTF